MQYYSVTNIILYILIIGIPLIAQLQISSSYNKYKKVKNNKGLTGFEVARKILDANGLEDIYVVEVAGDLTDHYDPTRKTVRLSTDIFHGDTIAAESVAAHECGHAIQDKIGYAPMRIRSFLVPIVNLMSRFSWIVILIGIFTQYFKIFLVGIGLISAGLIFQVVTLPVEFNASSRAKDNLKKLKITNSDEDTGVSKMLHAAAMTYVASVLTSILEILRLFMAFNNRK
jgi:Zn-dependent membrane protease YugP